MYISLILISIHLMLMLIPSDTVMPSPHTINFNTSHVNVNQENKVDLLNSKWHFNTSHVNVNRQQYQDNICSWLISIHLMLMLIKGLYK